MAKHLLTLAAVAALALNASAYDLPLTSEDTADNAPLNAGWSSSYDQTTQTITYEGDWTGRGWGFWGAELDASTYDDLNITMAPANVPGQVVVEYAQLVYDENGDVVQEWGNDKHEQSVIPFAIGDEKVSVRLKNEYKDKITQIYLQCGSIAGIEVPTITLLSATLEAAVAADSYVVFEGEHVIDWWEHCLNITTNYFDYLTPGAKIEISFSAVDPSVEGPCFKLQALNADWTQTWLPSLAQIPTAGVAEDGSDVHVPVTEPCTITCPINQADAQVINAPGVQRIMLVGQGVTVSKIEIIPANSGIHAVEATDLNATPVYYNLQGVQVSHPAAGSLYIVKRGQSVSKQIIR